ncbi:MAG: NADH:ubiquinone reductase (Na(+)-transporting) subunit A [Desulfofustis sp.]|nr:NADH:ubiquinone reductase (Na(+)-transporting) subunit A [Desulfofustis sp.]
MSFCDPDSTPDAFSPEELRRLLIDSGLWCALRTRPYGKIPTIDSNPASLFVTAIDTAPLAPAMEIILSDRQDDFLAGLTALYQLLDRPMYLCLPADWNAFAIDLPGVEPIGFAGPHPAGLPSTHIHFLDPVHEQRTVWQIGAQDVVAIGALLRTGQLITERIVSLAGPSVKKPRHLTTRLGAAIGELCTGEIIDGTTRLLSGSVLDGRLADERAGFLGRYHQQISCLPEGTGRAFFGWLLPGGDRFSVTRAFWSAFRKPRQLPLDTAVWGGHRAIFPLGTYEKVMPLDMIPTYLLKSLASGNTEKAKQLGCLELIEEDLALCSYVCPGKNDFGPMLRDTLTSIEIEG